MKDGLPNILFLRAESVFNLYLSIIFLDLASEIISSLFKSSSLQISEMLGSIAGSLPS